MRVPSHSSNGFLTVGAILITVYAESTRIPIQAIHQLTVQQPKSRVNCRLVLPTHNRTRTIMMFGTDMKWHWHAIQARGEKEVQSRPDFHVVLIVSLGAFCLLGNFSFVQSQTRSLFVQ
ncbi:hypothetical protein BDR04DRAFT_1101192 [Suillus decipiens]|nr:hypothetical protein BDR04DRAFT_1101192 [Suillus decipiens]